MKVLYCVNEVRGLYKLGGLGDVGRDLPDALTTHQVDIRLAVPYHPEIASHTPEIQVDSFTITYAQEKLPVKVFLHSLPGSKVPVYLFHQPKYLSKNTDASDNHADKYAVFSLAVATWATAVAHYWQPHLIHLNDWHTALIPLILKHALQSNYPTLLTIHNLAFQGNTDTPVLNKLDIPTALCRPSSLENDPHHLNILLQGIIHANKLNTVSPTYAQEITTPDYGFGLDPYLLSRQASLTGILNGLSSTEYQPQNDSLIDHPYDHLQALEGKYKNRQALCQKLQLDPQKPLIGYIGRVDSRQKGIPLLLKGLHSGNFPPAHAQFVFLGTGEPDTEKQLHQCASDRICIITRFDEPLAHQLYAASSVLVIPSAYEPCGLVQLMAMRYGTIPVAFATGGLKDTIDHQNTGFLFAPYLPEKFYQALDQVLQVLSDPTRHQTMVTNMMQQPFTYLKPAAQYLSLYKQILNLPQ